MKFTFDFFHGNRSPSSDFIEWVAGWWYRVVGLPVENGVLSNGDEWLLIGWFLEGGVTSEIINRFWKEGVEVLYKADGQFVLAVASKSSGNVEIFRDWTGIIPTVYAQGQDGLAVSAWISNVVSLIGIDSSPSEALLRQYPVYRETFVPDTPVDGVRSLSGKHSLRIENCRFELREHRRHSISEISYISLEAASQDLGRILSQSVIKRIRNCTNLGAWLSGGNDSSLLVALAREHYHGVISTVFVTFESYQRNYAKYAAVVAKKFETDHIEVVVRPKEYLNLWAKTISTIQAPLNHPGTIGQEAALKELPISLKTLLAGEGADSVFGGPYWAWMIGLSHIANIMSPSFRRFVTDLSEKLEEKTLFSKGIAKFLKALGTPLREYMLYGHTIGNEENIDRVFGLGTWQRTLDSCLNYIGEDPLTDLIYFLMLDWFPATIGANMRLGFSHDLFFVFPYFDYELMQNSFRLPVRLRYHYSTKKAALKKYALNYFNRKFVYKPKEGFGVPLSKWFMKPEFQPFLNLPLEERSLRRGWWDEKELRKVIDSHRKGEGNDKSAESIPWIATNLELWARICLEGDSPEHYHID